MIKSLKNTTTTTTTTTHTHAATYKNLPSGICGQRRPKSACVSVQSPKGLYCPLSETLDTTIRMNEEQKPGS